MNKERPAVVGLVLHRDRDEANEVAAALTTGAAARGLATTTLRAEEALPDDLDLLIGIGGDGTVLAAAALALDGDLPVVGVNLGHVGYLADIEPRMVGAMLDGIQAGSLEETTRMTVEVVAHDGRRWVGVNEVVVEKLESRRLVQIMVEIDDRYFTTYRADGIITATPLGSTAYSLSAGGPVIDPALDALIVTPVAPHSLLSRSMVLSPRTSIRYTVELDRPVRLNIDGRGAAELGSGEAVTVGSGPKRIRFLSLGTHPFPQAVRNQFGLDHA
jgi:NAD+ kinase